ncbi:MAG TPA: hypothetical protein VI603_19600 [Saprospiraceae bacterium]|nr:hypothetical protein [Saprospiraceae bacterium]
MFIRLIIALILLVQIPVRAQLIDDFADGDLTSNPAWIGNITDFIVNPAKVLQLNAAIAGTSVIHTPVVFGDSVEWSFYYRMEFAPSVSNRFRIYLMLDSDTLSVASGYFIEIGENGSADALRLYRLDNGSALEIAGSESLFGGDPSEARLQIRRDQNGLWSFFADLTGGMNYTLLFTTSETTYALSTAKAFCIECTYTDTRKDKFFFDDFFVGIPAPDTSAANLIGLVVHDDTHLTVQFDEELDPSSALEPTYYTILPGIGSPAMIEFSDAEHRAVDLVLGSPLQTHIDYSLHVTGVVDLSGNITDANIDFGYIRITQPNPYDILVNEIMADPSPPLGLPNAEYIELYNKSLETFQLENYALTVGSQTVLLPQHVMEGSSYSVLVDKGDSALFSGIANVLLIDLPALTNSGTTIEISDDLGSSLHRISYDVTSYQDPSRDEGGWSLELINPLAPCILTSNLRASLDLTGGTPGRQNSVTTIDVADTSGPILLRVFPESATVIQCVFDEVISEGTILISLHPEHTFTAFDIEDNILTITMQTPLQQSTLYTLTVQQISDCIGNAGENQSQTFALPQAAEEGDLFINEILFDPVTGGSRFIEVINISNKYIDLSELIIADIQGDTISAFPVETSFLCYPLSIAAITPSPQDIRIRYFTHDPAQIIFSSLPSFDRTAGNATIYTRSGIILDVFDYRADFHNALLDDTKGVSLERISTLLNTQSRETWHSAAETAGFGTPGLPNSQRLPDLSGEGVVEIEPEVFSPDEDGRDDFLIVSFPGVSPGMVASVRVFDAQGRYVIRLAENMSIGQDAVIRWDGVDESGSRARIGPYVLWIELYGANGTVERYKRTCVLAERL